MRLEERPDRLVVDDEGVAVLEYVFAPTDPPLESPRPYALLRTRSGTDATAYRPADHVWHKGLSLALPNVGDHNFWGGPTYVQGEGYVQLPNNGAQVHRSFRIEGLRVVEELDWIAEDGAPVLAEERTLAVEPVDAATWALSWRSILRNVSGDALAFGSPTTKGRPDAGYAGIFWRGTDAFTGGEILAEDGARGDAARGEPAPWLAHVSADRSAGILMLAPGHAPWFARSAEYPGLAPAPFFHDETVLAAGDALTLSAVVLTGGPDVAAHAAGSGARLVADLREDPA